MSYEQWVPEQRHWLTTIGRLERKGKEATEPSNLVVLPDQVSVVE